MAEIDPFSLVYNALWEMIETFPLVENEVRVGNRIKLNTKARDPIKDVVRVGDLPELILWPLGGPSNLCSTSSTTDVDRTYQLGISSGDKRVDEIHFPLQWYCIRALIVGKSTIGSLTWKDQKFVSNLNLIDTLEGNSDPELNRNIPGWSSLMSIQIQMRFNTSQLKMEQ